MISDRESIEVYYDIRLDVIKPLLYTFPVRAMMPTERERRCFT